MPDSNSPHPPLHDLQDTELAHYRAICGWAVAALVCGLAAPLALLALGMWLVPASGVLCAAIALWRIGRPDSGLTGRKAALAGLLLSLLFGAMAAGDWFACRWMVRGEARRVAEAWFACLAEGRAEAAHQLTLAPHLRAAPGEALGDIYRSGPRRREELEQYVARPAVRKLLDLGPRAAVRYDRTAGQQRYGDREIVEPVYAVAFDEGGGRKSLSVLLHLERRRLDSGAVVWHVWQVLGAELVGEPAG